VHLVTILKAKILMVMMLIINIVFQILGLLHVIVHEPLKVQHMIVIMFKLVGCEVGIIDIGQQLLIVHGIVEVILIWKMVLV
jgi:hypothetical protein